MRLKVIACEVVARELYACAARARCSVDVTLLPQGLHDNSDTLRGRLQAMIDAVDPERFDALLLGYGLCNNSLSGVRAGHVPMIVPRAHDCITLLLGSKVRYAKLFAECPGTYWFSSGWLECRDRRGERIDPRQNSGLGPLYKTINADDLVARYGKEIGQYLSEFMGHWEGRYTRGVLIRFDFDRDLRHDVEVRRLCQERGWRFEEVPGDISLLQAACNGQWDEARFLTVAPGQAVRPCYDDAILSAEPCQSTPPKEERRP